MQIAMTFDDALWSTTRLAALVAGTPAALVHLETGTGAKWHEWIPRAPEEDIEQWRPDAMPPHGDAEAPADAGAVVSEATGTLRGQPTPYLRVSVRSAGLASERGCLCFPFATVQALSDAQHQTLARLAELIGWQCELYDICHAADAANGVDDARSTDHVNAALRLRDLLSGAEAWLTGLCGKLPCLSSLKGRMSIEVLRHSVVLMRERCRQIIESATMRRTPPRAFELDVYTIAQAAATRIGRGRAASWLDLEELPPALGDPVLVEQLFEDVLVSALSRAFSTREPRLLIRGTALEGHSVYRFIDNGALWDAATAQTFLSFVPGAGTAKASLLSGELALARQAAVLQGGQLCVVQESRGHGSTMVCLILPAPEAAQDFSADVRQDAP